MKDEFLQKRIEETITEIFPLDRLLPLESIYIIFEKEYIKSEDKSLFFRDRKFQRLREGYFAMFVALSLQDISSKIHYLVFPSNHDNDFYIAYKMNDDKKVPKFGAYKFDIKEFTEWSTSLKEFIEKSIIPKIDIYNIAIATYKKIDSNDIRYLIDYLKTNNLDTNMWVLGSPTEIDSDYNISGVIVFNKDGIVYNKKINLGDWINKDKKIFVFQDIIRFK